MPKITGYKIFESTGGRKCMKCGTIINKKVPFMSACYGEDKHKYDNRRAATGKSLCVLCMRSMVNEMERMASNKGKEIDKFTEKVFVNNL